MKEVKDVPSDQNLRIPVGPGAEALYLSVEFQFERRGYVDSSSHSMGDDPLKS